MTYVWGIYEWRNSAEKIFLNKRTEHFLILYNQVYEKW